MRFAIYLMKLLIKNMVSIRCKMIVRSELENLGITYSVVELGEVSINEVPGVMKYNQLKAALLAHGLEILEDKKSILIEKIKNTIV
ncbi:MAG: helix-turn-helix transcriptional regulator, partial [Flavipsychrobacter sp.]|nr:helix-turn-helix transcriptional regulator [Flavipsychrobacter sp.]